ncbi:uncharacterized protein FIBRA_02857 [Fibroporia radiculosa]|uniref:AB hydrolase-1 domain-containing protein n=1 Tax=Fibroporia radiculosa TaxID=599839 RepID=J4GN58_9APHY|nr:uncharacterized protein FIBRA_02857 [Fibroporia radiculosa]CCM00815.1 predicted protein [Fibroporia radiculosa]
MTHPSARLPLASWIGAKRDHRSPDASGNRYGKLRRTRWLWYSSYAELFGTYDGGSFDILDFDPRGVGVSTPLLHCFDSDAQQKIWDLPIVSLLPNITDSSIRMVRARARAVGKRCEELSGGNGKVDLGASAEEWGAARFMSTASVATDMLKITEKLGQDKVHYWGYFAAMYPDKVGHMVLDGVFDAYDYRSSMWNTNFMNTNSIFDAFFSLRHVAGPDKCAMYDSTQHRIRMRVDSVMQRLAEEPAIVPFAHGGPALITTTQLQQFQFLATYSPFQIFSYLADLLVAIERNNQTALALLTNGFTPLFICAETCRDAPDHWAEFAQALAAIACGDGDPVSYDSEGQKRDFERMYAQASFAAPFWTGHYLRCAEWRIRPKWRYTGSLKAAQTAHPLLLLSPRYNPVAPLLHAQAVQIRYGRAGLLVQNS